MRTTEQIENNLKYELKVNDMILMIPTVILLVKKQKQTLIGCIASILGIQNHKLHEIICNNLIKYLESHNLPRKLSFIQKDQSNVQDYKRCPDLASYMKVTLQMVSQIFQIKITLFYLNGQGFLTGLIVNQNGYQQEIKIARIFNNYYEVRQSSSPNSHHSSAKQNPSSSSHHSYKLYETFDVQLLPKKNQIKNYDNILAKSYTNLPGSPLLKKNVSHAEERSTKNIILPELEIKKPVLIVPTQIKRQFDDLSIQNGVDDQQLTSAHQLAQSIKFGKQNLTQSLTLQKNTIQPTVQHQQSPVPPQIQQGNPMIHSLDQGQSQAQSQQDMYYAYYSSQIYYPSSYLMGQNGNRNDNYNNFNNITPTPVSPGKNSIRRQNSTLEINENERYTGRLKFFDEAKNYGFIIMDADQSDIFVHCDDLQKAGISKERVRSYKQSEGVIRFSYKVMSYFGKYKESRKAVDLIILDDGLGMPSLYS